MKKYFEKTKNILKKVLTDVHLWVYNKISKRERKIPNTRKGKEMLKHIEITLKDGSKIIEAYNPEVCTAKEAFTVLSVFNAHETAPDSQKTESYIELD